MSLSKRSARTLASCAIAAEANITATATTDRALLTTLDIAGGGPAQSLAVREATGGREMVQCPICKSAAEEIDRGLFEGTGFDCNSTAGLGYRRSSASATIVSCSSALEDGHPPNWLLSTQNP
jgi:hypothetical protein